MAARIVTLSDETLSSDLLDGLGWERLENFRLKQLAVLMYKISNNLSTLYLKQTHIFFHSAPEEGLYCKPKYRAILLKII